VEIIRGMYAAWLAQDIRAVYETFDEDIELNPDPQATWVGIGQTYRGLAGIKRYMAAVYDAFEGYRPEVEELMELGDGRRLGSWGAAVPRGGGLRVARGRTL
jgi:ketosteroid isomerase-like protein